MPVHKFVTVVNKLYERRVPENKKKKGRKHLLGPNVFIWNILEKAFFHNHLLYLSLFSCISTVDSSSLLNSAGNV